MTFIMKFIVTKHNLPILEVVPFFKAQNNS